MLIVGKEHITTLNMKASFSCFLDHAKQPHSKFYAKTMPFPPTLWKWLSNTLNFNIVKGLSAK